MYLQRIPKRFYMRNTDLPENIEWKTVPVAKVVKVEKVIIKEPFHHFKWSRDAVVDSSIGKVFEFEKNPLVDVKNVSNSLARQVNLLVLKYSLLLRDLKVYYTENQPINYLA
jgi:hypothetical protein